MIVKYKNKQLEKVCNNFSFAKRKYGEKMTVILFQRIKQLLAAKDVDVLLKNSVGRCHSLIGNRKNQYAMDLLQPYRLIFAKLDDTIQIVCILEIVDYH